MQNRTVRMSALVAAAATVLLIAITVQTQSPALTQISICISSDGGLRVLTASEPTCRPSEQQMNWVVGGDVTDIAPGRGLVGSRQGGRVQIGIDPDVLQGCTMCTSGSIVAGFNDGPAVIPAGGFLEQTIASLPVPAGSYTIFAKMTVFNDDDPGQVGLLAGDDRAGCTPHAGVDSDHAEIVLADQTGEIIQQVEPREGTGVLALHVVHHFPEPGVIVLRCLEDDPDQDLYVEDLKIVAIEAAHLSNSYLGQ